jgi:hypothetical protein
VHQHLQLHAHFLPASLQGCRQGVHLHAINCTECCTAITLLRLHLQPPTTLSTLDPRAACCTVQASTASQHADGAVYTAPHASMLSTRQHVTVTWLLQPPTTYPTYCCCLQLRLGVSCGCIHSCSHAGIGLLGVCECGCQLLQLVLQLLLLALQIVGDVRQAQLGLLLLQTLQPGLNLRSAFVSPGCWQKLRRTCNLRACQLGSCMGGQILRAHKGLSCMFPSLEGTLTGGRWRTRHPFPPQCRMADQPTQYCTTLVQDAGPAHPPVEHDP